MKQKAIILFSSGLDSTTVLYYALSKGYECHCLIFDYGQKHNKEVQNAASFAKSLKLNYHIVKTSIPWDTSSLTDKNKKIPEHKKIKKGFVPSTYVPGRNTIFLSYAISYAETIKAKKVFLGINAVDFSSYPDCTPKYLKAMQQVMKSLGNGIEIVAPIEKYSKAQIIKLGTKLKVPYEKTWSCYNGKNKPCGKCDSCKLRAKGFKEAGIDDPAFK
ncbi:MAG: 7-cyano-7-deazaguanine synthase QueC [Elusimicrobia bacterium]|nr:7-cyano-7-deazaguanine synthase QueC [Elusimicrobiota bacterium]MBR4632361.1 7-cyano-7-deazaguanine synthase QueC [Elusimicrobiota bacterium]